MTRFVVRFDGISGPAPRIHGAMEAVLESWRRYGEACVDHLPGEFAFAIVDGPRLFAARDRFGVRPLYYARHEGTLFVSNSLGSLLEVVPRELDQQSLEDFMIHGFPVDPARTMFARIARVPPAHRLIAGGERDRVERYWSMPIRDAPIRISEREAAETFRELLVKAVSDRVRGDVVVSMSGGLDSTSIAAAAVHGGASVRALTAVWDELIPDEERRFATEAAHALGIPIEFQVCDGYQPFERWNEPLIRGIEPSHEPYSAAFHDFMAMAAQRGTVLLGGWGGDPLLATTHDYFFNHLRRGRWLRAAREAAHYAATRRRLPPLLLRSRLLRRLRVDVKRDVAPEWLMPHLRVRWNDPIPPTDARTHPFRPEAFRAIHSAAWQAVFESYDESKTGQAIAFAAPFFDATLLEFAFSLPPMPYFAGKDLLRQAMRGWLPDRVRLRPKTPLRGDPLSVVWPEAAPQWSGTIDATGSLDRFVHRRILREVIREGTTTHVRPQAHAIGLAHWLRFENIA